VSPQHSYKESGAVKSVVVTGGSGKAGRTPPAFAPITEDHPLTPETGYELAKVLCEQMAREMHRWNPQTRFVEGDEYHRVVSVAASALLRSLPRCLPKASSRRPAMTRPAASIRT
jgi:hypothetical protein